MMSTSGRNSRISKCLFIHIIFLFVSVFIPVATWATDRVPIPRPELDQAPIITVGAVASGGSAEIQYVPASSSSCASPCKNSVRLRDKNGTADIVLTINAENPKGGVEHLGVAISQHPSLNNVSRSATPDARNLVPVSLPILGTNKKGGIGSYPILIHLGKKQTNATVLVEASNFNGQKSLYSVTYYVSSQVTGNERPHLGGSLTVGLNFTCAGEQVYAKATFEGHCAARCNKPGPNSKGMFTNTVPESVRCAGGNGVLTKSFADLESGDWEVTVTPDVPSMNLEGPSSTCSPVTIKAGEYYHRVDFYYVRDPKTYGWTGSCRKK